MTQLCCSAWYFFFATIWCVCRTKTDRGTRETRCNLALCDENRNRMNERNESCYCEHKATAGSTCLCRCENVPVWVWVSMNVVRNEQTVVKILFVTGNGAKKNDNVMLSLCRCALIHKNICFLITDSQSHTNSWYRNIYFELSAEQLIWVGSVSVSVLALYSKTVSCCNVNRATTGNTAADLIISKRSASACAYVSLCCVCFSVWFGPTTTTMMMFFDNFVLMVCATVWVYCVVPLSTLCATKVSYASMFHQTLWSIFHIFFHLFGCSPTTFSSHLSLRFIYFFYVSFDELTLFTAKQNASKNKKEFKTKIKK